MKKIKWYWWALIIVVVIIIISQVNRLRVMKDLSKTKLSANFSLDEFVVTSTGVENIPDDAAIVNLKLLVENILQPLRDAIGKPIKINSGYRSPAVNAVVPGSAKNSQHMNGQASDIHIEGMTNQQIIDKIRALKLPYDQIIDEQRGSSLWVHVSYNKAGARKQWLTRRDPGPGRPTEYETVQIG